MPDENLRKTTICCTEEVILSGAFSRKRDWDWMALWRIPFLGAEGENSVSCESLRQKDRVMKSCYYDYVREFPELKPLRFQLFFIPKVLPFSEI